MTRSAPLVPVLVFGCAAAVVACRAGSAGEAEAPSSRPAARSPGAPRPAPGPRPAAEPGRVAGVTAAHNQVREPLGLPPLEWSRELADHAQRWADELRRRGCPLDHRPRSGPFAQRFGENLYSRTGPPARADEVVAMWAAERQDYDARTSRCRGVCGHYTQIVWRDSRRLGCAAAACGDTEVWVCNYDPPGNVIGRRPY